MEISIANRQRRIGIRSSSVRMIAASVLERETAPFDEISIVFLGAREMQKVNRTFTGRDEPTDTLAFELTPSIRQSRRGSGLAQRMPGVRRGRAGMRLGASATRPGEAGIRLGEVIVCPARAVIQSKHYRVSVGKELARLLIHGLLHLCGFDDTTKDSRVRMHKRENLYIASLGDAIASLTTSKARKTLMGQSRG